MTLPPLTLGEAFALGGFLVIWLNLRVTEGTHWVTRCMISVVLLIVGTFGIFLIGFVSEIVLFCVVLLDYWYCTRHRR